MYFDLEDRVHQTLKTTFSIQLNSNINFNFTLITSIYSLTTYFGGINSVPAKKITNKFTRTLPKCHLMGVSLIKILIDFKKV